MKHWKKCVITFVTSKNAINLLCFSAIICSVTRIAEWTYTTFWQKKFSVHWNTALGITTVRQPQCLKKHCNCVGNTTKVLNLLRHQRRLEGSSRQTILRTEFINISSNSGSARGHDKSKPSFRFPAGKYFSRGVGNLAHNPTGEEPLSWRIRDNDSKESRTQTTAKNY